MNHRRLLASLVVCTIFAPAILLAVFSSFAVKDWYSTVVIGFGFLLVTLMLGDGQQRLLRQQSELQARVANLELQEKIGMFHGHRANAVTNGESPTRVMTFLLSDARAGLHLYPSGSPAMRDDYRQTLLSTLDAVQAQVLSRSSEEWFLQPSAVQVPGLADKLISELLTLAQHPEIPDDERQDIQNLAGLLATLTIPPAD